MHININAIELCMAIPDCLTAEEIRDAALDNEHLSALADLIL